MLEGGLGCVRVHAGTTWKQIASLPVGRKKILTQSVGGGKHQNGDIRVSENFWTSVSKYKHKLIIYK